jgi:hypothetical protein
VFQQALQLLLLAAVQEGDLDVHQLLDAALDLLLWIGAKLWVDGRGEEAVS